MTKSLRISAVTRVIRHLTFTFKALEKTSIIIHAATILESPTCNRERIWMHRNGSDSQSSLSQKSKSHIWEKLFAHSSLDSCRIASRSFNRDQVHNRTMLRNEDVLKLSILIKALLFQTQHIHTITIMTTTTDIAMTMVKAMCTPIAIPKGPRKMPTQLRMRTSHRWNTVQM